MAQVIISSLLKVLLMCSMTVVALCGHLNKGGFNVHHDLA